MKNIKIEKKYNLKINDLTTIELCYLKSILNFIIDYEDYNDPNVYWGHCAIEDSEGYARVKDFANKLYNKLQE